MGRMCGVAGVLIRRAEHNQAARDAGCWKGHRDGLSQGTDSRQAELSVHDLCNVDEGCEEVDTCLQGVELYLGAPFVVSVSFMDASGACTWSSSVSDSV
eukprot:1609652-Rhodomonas_salina.1